MAQRVPHNETPVFKAFQRNLRVVGALRLERGDWVAWQGYRDPTVHAGEVISLPTRYSPNVWVETGTAQDEGTRLQIQPQYITSVNGRPVRS